VNAVAVGEILDGADIADAKAEWAKLVAQRR
jgi:hypothetical protein